MTTTPSPLARYLRKDGKEWQHTARPVRVKKQTNKQRYCSQHADVGGPYRHIRRKSGTCLHSWSRVRMLFVCRKLRLEKAAIWQPPPPLLQNTFCQLSIRSPLMWRQHRDALTSQLDYNRRRISLLSTSCMFAPVFVPPLLCLYTRLTLCACLNHANLGKHDFQLHIKGSGMRRKTI